MQLIKYAHACVRVESDAAVLVIDPGMFTERVALDGADAVLITHEHDIAAHAARVITLRDGVVATDQLKAA